MQTLIKPQKLILVLATLAISIAVAVWLKRAPVEPQAKPNIKLPAFSAIAKAGQAKFAANCQPCHGKHATGTTQGPPLVHIIYRPGHHSDLSFYRAARYGVRAHHWPFGDMPPVKGVTREDVSQIIQYVRELQRANGIS